MISYRVSDLSGKEILAENLYSSDGQILMQKGVHLKTDYIDYLLNCGIDTIWIKNPYDQKIRPNYYLEKERIFYYHTELKRILEQHIYKKNSPLKKIKDMANEIVLDLLHADLTLAMDIQNRKSDLYEHLIYTTILSVVMGIRIGLKNDRLIDMAFGCLIHDLGLRYINVSYKNCNLSQMEPKDVYELKTHTILGYTSLEDDNWISQKVKNIVLSHHEKKDGSGYPLKQKNQEQELRVIQICDTFDGMISGIECEKKDILAILSEIVQNRDIKYGIDETDQLLCMVGKYPAGSTVELTGHHYAIVTSQTDDPDKPEIILLEDNCKKYNLKTGSDLKIL